VRLLKPGGVVAINCISDPELTPSLVSRLAEGLAETSLHFDLFAVAAPSSHDTSAAAVVGVGVGGTECRSLAFSRERVFFARHRCSPAPPSVNRHEENTAARADLTWALSKLPSLVENSEGWISNFIII